METDLIRIGNSRGIRIPKPVIRQCGFGAIVELRVEKNNLVISARRKLREGWHEAFRRAGSSKDDELLLDAGNQFDEKEWQW